MFVNPPDEKDSDDPLLVYILSSKLDQVDQNRLNNHVLSPALDKTYRILEICEENMKVITSHPYLSFYETKLNVRRKFFGKKPMKEILSFKSTRLNGGSMIPLDTKDVSSAMSHFEEMLQFVKEVNTLSLSLNQHY